MRRVRGFFPVRLRSFGLTIAAVANLISSERLMRKLFFTFLLIFPALAVSAQQPNASDIFQKVSDVYSGCRSYSDEVLVSFKIAGFALPLTFQQHFRTAY